MREYLAFSLAIGLAALFVWQLLRQRAKLANQGRELFAPVLSLFDRPQIRRSGTAGVWTLEGLYQNHSFQLKTIADTLATRKLPSLWLMVTLPEPQPVVVVTDMMMRAAGVSSFSNFDFLPHTLALPHGFPEQATLRSDNSMPCEIPSLLLPHLHLFHHGRGKEFLVSPQGLRLVVQLAESDKARYGVFREASFADRAVDVDLATSIMDTLINLRNDIHHYAKT